MDVVTINFTANEQELVLTNGIEGFASNTVNYVQAVFELGENWTGYDSVSAVWRTGSETIATVLDSNGACIVPTEVLDGKSVVMVNLVGSTIDNDVVTERLTTYSIVALTVNGNALVSGTETTEITASQFEQFVNVIVNRPLYPSDGQ